jgi:hypothetical protein
LQTLANGVINTSSGTSKKNGGHIEDRLVHIAGAEPCTLKKIKLSALERGEFNFES